MRFWNGMRRQADDVRRQADDAATRGVRRGRRVRARLTGEDRPSLWRTALPAAILGAVAAYLLDPDRGRGRRAKLADQAGRWMRRGTWHAQRTARMVGSTVQGKVQAFSHRSDDEPMLNDATLAEKVESELFRDPAIPKGKMNINVEHGRVVLRGEVNDDRQRRKLERQASRIPGVWSVENLLHLPGEPAPGERVQAAG